MSNKRLSRINFDLSACLDADSDSSGSACELYSIGLDFKSALIVISALFVDIRKGLILLISLDIK